MNEKEAKNVAKTQGRKDMKMPEKPSAMIHILPVGDLRKL